MNATAQAASLTAQGSSPALLLPGAVGFYFAARMSITYLFFQSDPPSGAIFNFTINLLLFVAVAFYTYGPGDNHLPSMLRVRPLRWVLLFLFVGCCSLLWSATVSAVIAFAYWSEMAARIVMILMLLRSGPTQKTTNAVLKGYVCGACFIALIEWLSPTMYDLRPGNDDYFSPNAIGFTCAFGAFMAQYLTRSSKVWRVAVVLLSISLLRSLSKTTIIAFVIGESFLLIRERSLSRKTKGALVIAAIAIAAAFWGLFAGYYEVYTNSGNQAETLTGRLGIWAFVLGKSLEQPWIGHGFHSFRNVIPAFGTFEAWHAHNEILQQFYAYGAVGIVLLIGVYGSFWKHLRRVTSDSTKALLFSLLLFIVVRGLADTENFDLSFPLWSIALFSVALAQSEVATHSDRVKTSVGLLSPGGQTATLTLSQKASQP